MTPDFDDPDIYCPECRQEAEDDLKRARELWAAEVDARVCPICGDPDGHDGECPEYDESDDGRPVWGEMRRE